MAMLASISVKVRTALVSKVKMIKSTQISIFVFTTSAMDSH